jgi:hypothetical protein
MSGLVPQQHKENEAATSAAVFVFSIFRARN